MQLRRNGRQRMMCSTRKQSGWVYRSKLDRFVKFALAVGGAKCDTEFRSKKTKNPKSSETPEGAGEFVMRPLILISATLLLAGCAEHRLVVQKPNPGKAPVEMESAAIGWGASQKRTVADCESNVIDEVRVKQNFGQSLLTVLTLGFYMPTTIEYVCAKVPTTISDGGDE
jgi:hypothetical protein